MTTEKIDRELIGRVKRVIEYYECDDTTFAKRIGVDKANLSKMLNGQRTIGEGIINKIVLNTEFRKTWLITGKGDPTLSEEDYLRIAENKQVKFKERENIVIPRNVWDVIESQAKSLAKRDSQIDDLISILKTEKKGVAGVGAARKAAVG